MHSTVVVALLGCVAAASGLTLVHPTADISSSPIGSVTGGSKKTSSYSYEKHTKVTNTKNGVVTQNDSTDESSDDSNSFGSSRLQVGNSLEYNVKQDFEQRINPVKQSSEWMWAKSSSNEEYIANYGTFLTDSHTNSVDLISLPYKGWIAQDDTRLPPIADSFQALLVNKKNVTVSRGEVLSAHVKFSCTTFNNEKIPLTRDSVTKPEDDPTLAACGFGIQSNDQSALTFRIIATNKGIWAAYQRNQVVMFNHPEMNLREFSYFKRIGSRSSSYEVVDAAIKYDRDQGKVAFILNGQVVYVIGDLGTLNQPIHDNPAYAEVYTQNRPDLVRSEPHDFQVVIGLTQFPDTIDPNNPSNPPLSSVKLTTDQHYYDSKARFEDDQNVQQNVQWGQGASMTLVEADIKLKVSTSRIGRHEQPEEENESAESGNSNNNDSSNDENNQQSQ